MDRLSKAQKIILGIVTLWPLLYVPIFIGFIFSFIFTASMRGGEFPSFLFVIFPLHFLTMIIVLGTLIFYLIDVFKNKKLSSDSRILWALVIFLGGCIGMAAYWYLYVWKNPSKHIKK